MKIKKNSKIYIAGYRGLVGPAKKKRLEEGGYQNLLLSDLDDLDLQR